MPFVLNPFSLQHSNSFSCQCDLKLPACRNCTRFNRRCEGYDRFPVFINRTTDGLLKRNPLEEAKLRSGRADDEANGRVDYALALGAGGCRSRTGPQMESRIVEAERYVSWFYDSFSPAQSSNVSDSRKGPHWFHYVMTLRSRQPALDEALLAISLAKHGKVYGESAVLEQGRQIYVRALSLLQQCLYDQNLAVLDETLATVCVMVMYEVSVYIWPSDPKAIY